LVPLGDPVRLIGQEGGIHDGARVEFEIGYRPFSIAEHSGYIQNRQFS